jgi:HAMP domain-containing protein
VIRRTGDDGWVYDSNGKALSRRGLGDLLARMKPGAMAAPEVETERLDDSMVLVRPLGTSEGTASTALMLEFSIGDALAEYDFLKLAVLIAGALGLALVAYASARLARHIVRPISALERAARSLAKGQWTSVPVTSDDELGLLGKSFNEMSAGIAQRESRIRHMAYHDALTDLPNRLQLRDKLEQMLDAIVLDGGELAVLCLDLDNFKITNDTLGPQVGDKLLKHVAARLADAADGHFLARTGGDEFCVVLTGAAVASPHRPPMR